jgi:hypothetical protein
MDKPELAEKNGNQTNGITANSSDELGTTVPILHRKDTPTQDSRNYRAHVTVRGRS